MGSFHGNLCYSSNKIRKTQNEHNHHFSKFDRPVVMNSKQISYFWEVFITHGFDLETFWQEI